MKVTLTRVVSNVKETKFGKKLSVGLKIKETAIQDINGTTIAVNDRFINGWFNEDFKFEHKEGDVVEILIATRGDYLDFKIPGVGKPPAPDMGSLIDRIVKLETAVFGDKEVKNEETLPAEPSTESVDPSDW